MALALALLVPTYPLAGHLATTYRATAEEAIDGGRLDAQLGHNWDLLVSDNFTLLQVKLVCVFYMLLQLVYSEVKHGTGAQGTA